MTSLSRNVKVIAEALGRLMYNLTAADNNEIFTDSFVSYLLSLILSGLCKASEVKHQYCQSRLKIRSLLPFKYIFCLVFIKDENLPDFSCFTHCPT